MLDIPAHDAFDVKIEHLPFFKSLQVVAQNTGLDQSVLLRSQIGFKASPDHCLCNHEWSAFDVIIDTVN